MNQFVLLTCRAVSLLKKITRKMKDDFECSVERNNISLFIIDVLIRGLMVDIFSHYRNNHLIFFTHSSAL